MSAAFAKNQCFLAKIILIVLSMMCESCVGELTQCESCVKDFLVLFAVFVGQKVTINKNKHFTA